LFVSSPSTSLSHTFLTKGEKEKGARQRKAKREIEKRRKIEKAKEGESRSDPLLSGRGMQGVW